MRFTYTAREADPGKDGVCWLLTNGLGGYASTSAAFSVTRRDQGLLVGAKSPSLRRVLVHRLAETVDLGTGETPLSSQTFAGPRLPKEGWRYLESFSWEEGPVWRYRVGEATITRRCAVKQGENTAAVLYELENAGDSPCTLRVRPVFPTDPDVPVTVSGLTARWAGWELCVRTSGAWEDLPPETETLFYADDEKDGRPSTGLGVAGPQAVLTVPPAETGKLTLVFSTAQQAQSAEEIWRVMCRRRKALDTGFRDPVARELARAADAFIAYRPSTGGKTIMAGYPFFGDWGRDTMIALPGCVLARGKYEDARSILGTFLAYERDGLVPNLFPEGDAPPRYNTVDAALLLINCVWLYYRATGDGDFVREAWPVLKRIVGAYQAGTRHAIAMDADGLIRAGEGLDQVTWMDVCVDGILPTPRHGKPVEINAYWYSALRIMEALAPVAGEPGTEYGLLAERVQRSFVSAFWMEDKGYLKDVLSGTEADEQIRCNQIWAVSMPFTMLSRAQEKQVVETVYRHLYTPCGLRTLSPEDPEFHPFYGGPQKDRDLAYHQGTVWPFPLGAWYLAYLKVNDDSTQAIAQVRSWLAPMAGLLREGCVGQLPEIYDGGTPGPSKGCFAQAWSVGELLRVYQALEQEEQYAG